jgi:hypothetical protein
MSTRMSGSFLLLRLLVPFLLGWTATADAAKFDERIVAPKAASPATLKALTREYFATYQRAQAKGVGGLIRDPAAYRQWFEWYWQLSETLDDKQPIGDLTEFGLIPQEDGSYTVDHKKYPQWAPLDRQLTILRTPVIFEAYAPELKTRGFRDQDLEVLKSYVDKHDPERGAFAENKPLVESFATKVQSLHRAKKSIQRADLKAYFYQSGRNADEAQRRWAVGLLDALDPQRQRILEAYFEELDVGHSIGPASGNFDDQLKTANEVFGTGQYQQLLKQEELEIRQ